MFSLREQLALITIILKNNLRLIYFYINLSCCKAKNLTLGGIISADAFGRINAFFTAAGWDF